MSLNIWFQLDLNQTPALVTKIKQLPNMKTRIVSTEVSNPIVLAAAHVSRSPGHVSVCRLTCDAGTCEI